VASSDFDIDSLAAYLHITPAQVLKLVQRDRIPGRRVGGDWKFSEAEIHHWLEERIGASDNEELTRMQAMLDRQAPANETELLVSQLCPVQRIAVPLAARTRGSVIRSMCELAASDGLLWDSATMAAAVEAREQMHPTALESGVALLHPRRPQASILAESLLALGICSQPLPFSDSGHLTDVFFLIASYDDRFHLRILAKLSQMLREPEFLPALRAATSPDEAHRIITDTQDRIFGHG
jgi:PTS system nitrogen regulatory IIA component